MRSPPVSIRNPLHSFGCGWAALGNSRRIAYSPVSARTAASDAVSWRACVGRAGGETGPPMRFRRLARVMRLSVRFESGIVLAQSEHADARAH